MYDEFIIYRDLVTKHNTLGGFLFNLALLKTLLRSEFQLHNVKQVLPSLVTDLISVQDDAKFLMFFKLTNLALNC
uniref:Uncharacterized protein n=1 Tax=Nelumbo nucifera TaxID=4432 RepID=A0A822ZSK8_NELNU|nr:TPA_asm: hypothetical protein HUJ06_004146 [Nelumbo nucifera]